MILRVEKYNVEEKMVMRRRKRNYRGRKCYLQCKLIGKKEGFGFKCDILEYYSGMW